MSFYYPFDSLVRLADVVNNNNINEQNLSSSSSNSRSLLRSKRNRTITPAFPTMDLIESKVSITAVLVDLRGLTKDKVDISLHESYGSVARGTAVPPGLKQEVVKSYNPGWVIKS